MRHAAFSVKWVRETLSAAGIWQDVTIRALHKASGRLSASESRAHRGTTLQMQAQMGEFRYSAQA